jgi:hypothetical protein
MQSTGFTVEKKRRGFGQELGFAFVVATARGDATLPVDAAGRNAAATPFWQCHRSPGGFAKS